MSDASKVVTRYAPSPTGYQHVGGARTALFSWLLARHFGGTYLLRIEDTDLARSTEDAVHKLVEDLQWLGLNWDNKELVFQSKRLDVYNKLIDGMIAKGQSYKAWETPAELEESWKAAGKAKRQYVYRRTEVTAEQVKQYEAEGRAHVVRFAMPVKDYRFDDAVVGPGQGVAADQVQDFVIRKSDGMPTFHLAVVVDDAEMGVTHVLRGQEHLLNTVNHIALQEALGYQRPVYAHLPVILAGDTGAKLSKRARDQKIRQRAHEWIRSAKKTAAELAEMSGIAADRLEEWLTNDKKQLDLSEQPEVMKAIGLREHDLPEIMVRDFRKNGYLPEVLNNFLALLGWSPGGDRERMTMAEMVELFSLEGVGKANARFNREKLVAFNKEAVAAATPERLLAGFRDYLKANPESPVNRGDDGMLTKLLGMKAGFRLFREVDEQARFLFLRDDEVMYEAAAVEKVLKKNEGEGARMLRELKGVFEALAEWTAGAIEGVMNEFAAVRQVKLNNVAQPLRVAVSGGMVSPPIFQSLEMLGRDATVRRMERALSV